LKFHGEGDLIIKQTKSTKILLLYPSSKLFGSSNLFWRAVHKVC